MIPGWPYSFVAALEPGPTSWTAILDAIRLPPGADVVAITAAQLCEVVMRLLAGGHWTAGDPEILIVTDAGYDAPRIAFLLTDLPVQILGRLRSDRVIRRPAPPYVYHPKGGRPPNHGGEFVFGDQASWGEPNVSTVTDNTRYAASTAQAWPILTHRAAWADIPGDLPVIAGTVIRLTVDHLPTGGEAKPVWLCWSRIDATAVDFDRVLDELPAQVRHRDVGASVQS